VVLVSIGTLSLLSAGGAQAATCSATNTETLESCVTTVNGNTEANTITVAAGTYTPEKPLVLTNTHGLQKIEGPASGPAEALIAGTNVTETTPELLVVSELVSASIKDVVIAHAGRGVSAGIEDFGTLTIEQSTLGGNAATALNVQPTGTATITNATISDGTTAFGIVNSGSTTLKNDTIAFNKFGIENSGTLSMTNTLLENTSKNCTNMPASTNDHNLASESSCGAEKVGATLLNHEFFNDGGPTSMHSLKPGSPAIDGGDPAASVCPTIDQRGQARPDVAATACDIGADEFNTTAPTLHLPAEIKVNATSAAGAVVTYSASAESSDDAVVSFGCTPASGSTFPDGTTEVHCTAVDGHETSATGTFKVVVTGIPIVTSLTARESGSNGGLKFKIVGSHFESIETGGVKMGGIACKKVTTITGKCQFRVLSTTEIEIENPLHEHGKVAVVVLNSAGSSGSETEPNAADEFTYLPEVYRNEAATAVGSHVPDIGYGQIQLVQSPHPNSVIECVNVGFGSGFNEGSPVTTGKGEILVWWASGHAPNEEHTELSGRCRFIYEGTTESERTSPEAWATAEPPLHKVEQQGIVCKNGVEALETCHEASERETTRVVKSVSLNREALALPWNVQFTEREGKARVQIGLPEECKGKVGTERTELERCPAANEREAGKNPAGCVISVTVHGPAPAGCVRVDIVTNPTLNLELPYEGYVEPLGTNGANNGLSPGSWEFQGAGKEECLHLRTNVATQGCTTGSVKILGYSGQELISVK
jgi:hypothetical protein